MTERVGQTDSGGMRELSSMQIPDTMRLRRGLPAGIEVSDVARMAGYDDTTLIYDTFYRADLGKVIIYLPKMLGFETLLRQAQFRVDGQLVSARFSRFRVFDRATLACKTAPKILEVDLNGEVQRLVIRQAEPALFANQNCLYTIQKDQDVDWVCDWVRFHIREQGATAAAICDNLSTRQDPEVLLDALRMVPGLRQAVVVPVPFPWGPTKGVSRRHGRTKFLQVAMMNLMRDRFLSQARAVLNCDVDELFLREGQETCFDSASRGLGYVSLSGDWRYAAPTGHPVRHADHWLQAIDPPSVAPKYCASPRRLLGRMVWGIHGLESLSRRLFKPLRTVRMIHCRNISTSWKVDREIGSRTDLIPDPAMKARLARVLTP